MYVNQNMQLYLQKHNYLMITLFPYYYHLMKSCKKLIVTKCKLFAKYLEYFSFTFLPIPKLQGVTDYLKLKSQKYLMPQTLVIHLSRLSKNIQKIVNILQQQVICAKKKNQSCIFFCHRRLLPQMINCQQNMTLLSKVLLYRERDRVKMDRSFFCSRT